MAFTSQFIELAPSQLSEEAARRKQDGWRFVQMLSVRVDEGNDLIYSFMKDGVLDNVVLRAVPREMEIPSVTDQYLSAFVFENEAHDLFGVNIVGIAIDFAGNFYRTSVKEPMSIISPEQLAAREKAAKIAAAKAAKEAKAAKAAKEVKETKKAGEGASQDEQSTQKGGDEA